MKKFNFYTVTDQSRDGYRQILKGVNYQNGWICATDSRMLVAAREEYAPELEGKTIDKAGAEIAGNFPKYWELSEFKRTPAGVVKLTREGLKQAQENAKRSQAKKRDQLVFSWGVLFRWAELEKFWRFCLAAGLDGMEINGSRAAYAGNENARALIMPKPLGPYPEILGQIIYELK